MAPAPESGVLADLARRKREQGVLLTEVSNLTRQISEAAERKDQVSVQMLLAMRDDPIRRMREIEDGIEAYLPSLPEEEGRRCHELLHGADPETPEEEALAAQTAKFHERLRGVVAQDEKLSVSLFGKKSFYVKVLKRR